MKTKQISTGLRVLPVGQGRRGLTVKQRLFVLEYQIDLNATKAAERAGYSKRTAQEQGSRLLSNVMVSAVIAEQQAKHFRDLEISVEWVLRELRLLAGANMLDYIQIDPSGTARVDLSKLTREQAAAIGEITVEEYSERSGNGDDGVEKVKRTRFKLTDKRGALVDLGRHLKLFTDKVQVEGDLRLEIRDVKQKLLAKLSERRSPAERVQ